MDNIPVASSLSSAVRWRIVVLLMGFAALGHFNRVGISVAGSEVFIPKLGLSETRMGWVYTAFLIVYTLGMLPGGWLIDRIGSARALTLYGVTMGVFVMLTGTLGWLTNSAEGLWLSLLVIRGLAGLCSSPLHPGAAHLVSDLMSDRSRATANGMVTAGAVIGIVPPLRERSRVSEFWKVPHSRQAHQRPTTTRLATEKCKSRPLLRPCFVLQRLGQDFSTPLESASAPEKPCTARFRRPARRTRLVQRAGGVQRLPKDFCNPRQNKRWVEKSSPPNVLILVLLN